jgi:hypothetical protein
MTREQKTRRAAIGAISPLHDIHKPVASSDRLQQLVDEIEAGDEEREDLPAVSRASHYS